MPRFRTVLAVLVALTLAFVPVVSEAMAKSCAMTSQITDDGTMDCPCHQSMPDCGTMPQCQTASGCASQCLTFCGTVPTMSGLLAPDHEVVKMRDGLNLSSLSITPPHHLPEPEGSRVASSGAERNH
jgi:hypothetical protein